jgi:hypothetical protein
MTEPAWKSAHEVCDKALRITQKDRNKANGDPEDNFAFIALTWTALLEARGVMFDNSGALNAADVARLMIAMKLCRDANAPHRDNRVDAIGYALCLERVEPTTPANPPSGEAHTTTHTETRWCATCTRCPSSVCPSCRRIVDGEPVPSHWVRREGSS